MRVSSTTTNQKRGSPPSEAEGYFFGGIDFGGTTCRFGILRPKGELVPDSREYLTEELVAGPESASDSVVSAFRKYSQEKDIGPDQLSGIGIGCPGPLNQEARENRTVETAANSPDLELEKEVDGVPLFLENDGITAAIGEISHGHGKEGNYDNLVHVVHGTGIGGGVIKGNRISSGAELGYCQVNPQIGLRMETFDKRNVWEAYASGQNIPPFFRKYCEHKDKDPEYVIDGEFTTANIFEHYHQGEPVVEEFTEDVLSHINASGYGNMINLFLENDEEENLLTTGGTVILEQPYLLDLAKEHLGGYALFIPEIKTAKNEYDTGVYGAAELARIRREQERRGMEDIFELPGTYTF